MWTPDTLSTLMPKSAERAEASTVFRSLTLASAAVSVGMTMRAFNCTLPPEMTRNVISLTLTPSLAAKLSRKVVWALPSKSSTSPAKVRVMSTTGLNAPPGLIGGGKGGVDGVGGSDGDGGGEGGGANGGGGEGGGVGGGDGGGDKGGGEGGGGSGALLGG